MQRNVVNTYAAGSIIDLMPDGMYDELVDDVVILTNNPTGERLQEFHGGIEFNITINNRKLHWKVTHNYNDFFDLELTPIAVNNINTEQFSDSSKQVEKDLGNGDLKNIFDVLWDDYVAFSMKKGQKEFLNTILKGDEFKK